MKKWATHRNSKLGYGQGKTGAQGQSVTGPWNGQEVTLVEMDLASEGDKTVTLYGTLD